MARRVMLRWSRLLVRWVMAAAVTLLVLAGALVWRISQGPISVGFLAPYVSDALALSDYGITAEFDDIVVAWAEDDEALRLRMYNARYRAAGGQVAMRIPTVDMALSIPALLHGVIAPRYVHVAGIQARIVRDRDGHFQVGIPAVDGDDTADAQPIQVPPPAQVPSAPSPSGPAAGQPAGPDLAEVMLGAVFNEMSAPRGYDNPLGQLDTVSISADRLVLEDWKVGQRWVVPGAQIVLQRGEGHVFASGTGALDFRGKRVNLDVKADYTLADRSAGVTLGFDNIEPADFADVVPELAPLKYLRTPLGGSLILHLNENGEQVDLGFDLKAGAGTVVIPDQTAAPLQLQEATFRGTVLDGGRRLQLDEANFAFADKFHFSLAGMVTRDPAPAGGSDRVGADLTGQFFDLSTDATARYWPPAMAKNARDWIIGHLHGGRISAGRFAAKLTPDMLDGTTHIPANAIKLDFAFEGVDVDYLPPMTKLTGGNGVASLDADTFHLTLEAAKVGPLVVDGGDVTISGLQDKDQFATISSVAKGSSRDLLALIDQKPLGFPSKLGIRPDQTSGSGSVKWRLKFPLESKLKLDDLTVSAEATMTDMGMTGLMGRYDLSGGAMTMKVDNKGLQAAGTAALNGVPVQIGWQQSFDAKAAVQARYNLKGRFDEAQRKALGYPLAPYIEGPADANLDIEERRGGEVAVGGEFDLTAATIVVAEAHVDKPAGEQSQGRILVRTKTGQPVQFDAVELTGPGLTVRARATLPQGGGWSAEVTRLKYGGGEIAGKVDFAANGDATIDMAGKRYDLQPFLKDAFEDEGGADDTKPRLVLNLRLDEAMIDKDLEMRNLALQVRREPTRLEHVSLTGGFAKAGGVTLTIAPELGARNLELVSDNAGAVLHFLGLTNMEGGTMQVHARYDDTKPGHPMAGKMEMKNVKAVRAPFLARLLGIGSFAGLSAVLNSEQGILFERGEVPFSQKNGVLTIGDSRLQGPQLGITFSGTVNNKTRAISVNGTAVPAFVLNTILGKIPILGDIFVGDGIIGVNFAVSGPKDDPQFTVNPLSAIAPGFLRKIFQAPEAAPPPLPGEKPKPVVPPPRYDPSVPALRPE